MIPDGVVGFALHCIVVVVVVVHCTLHAAGLQLEEGAMPSAGAGIVRSATANPIQIFASVGRRRLPTKRKGRRRVQSMSILLTP